MNVRSICVVGVLAICLLALPVVADDSTVSRFANDALPGTVYVSAACGDDDDDGTCSDSTCVACGAGTKPKATIQAGIDGVAAAGEVIIYRNTGHARGCYNEHITIDNNITVRGDSTTPANATCIGPEDGADADGQLAIVDITADSVTLKDLEISGKTGALDTYSNGGRSYGEGIYITGNAVTVQNCTVSFARRDLIRWKGGTGNYVIIQGNYLHHADTGRAIRVVGGGSGANPHKIRNNLIAKSEGILLTGDVDYADIEKNIIRGWAYWGHLPSGTWPEDNSGQEANYGGGWRWYSRCAAGIWLGMDAAYGDNVNIYNNLIYGTAVGIRVNQRGNIVNNTIVNPFNAMDYDWTVPDPASNIRDQTYGIMLQSNFRGKIVNNIVAITDNRTNGKPGKNAIPYYTPGITGYGIAFWNDTGSSNAAAQIGYNNVWGFVDTDGIKRLNYGTDSRFGVGGKISNDDSTTNISVPVEFAPDDCTDTASDACNGSPGYCPADIANSRCYEIYDDNFFLPSVRGVDDNGSCHANIWHNVAAYVGFVDLSNGGSNNLATDDFSNLDDCVRDDDSTVSRLIDLGDANEGMGNESHGGSPDYDLNVPNLGAFGRTDRASWSSTFRIVGIDVGEGGTKYDSGTGEGDDDYWSPGLVQPRSAGLSTVNIWFNRPATVSDSNFVFSQYCDGTALATDPTVSGGSTIPYKVTLTWASPLTNQGVHIKAWGSTAAAILDDALGQTLDGYFDNADTDTVPSGNGGAGTDAKFRVYALTGDVDGDLDVDDDDLTDIGNLDNSTATHLPEDMDDDGTVDGGGAETDYLNALAEHADYWVNSTSDNIATTTTLQYAMNNMADNDTIKFKIDTFAPCADATITNTVDTDPIYPEITESGITIDSTDTTVIISDENDVWTPTGVQPIFEISGSNNTLQGLRIENWNSAAFGVGLYVNSTSSGNTIGGDYDGTALNQLGEGNLFGGFGDVAIRLNGADSNVITGNLIGTGIDGTAGHAEGTIGSGIYLASSADSNTIGGTTAAKRNVVSYGLVDGIYIGGSLHNVVIGNYIGTDINGTVDLGHTENGIEIAGATNTIGGTTAGERNIISGNTGSGVYVASTNNIVQGNWIGVDSTGTTALANGGDGVHVYYFDKNNNTIGGTAAGAGNVIGGNTGDGIQIYADDNTVVYGNYIGTDSTGTTDVGNGGYGVHISDFAAVIGSTSNTIGGTGSNEGNTIAFNDSGGIYATHSLTVDNSWRGNLVYDNSSFEIDLANSANNSIAAPAISCADTGQVQGTMTVANGTNIDVYSNDTVGGDKDMDVFVGSTTVTSNAFTLSSITLTSGHYVVAVATDASGDSSEPSATAVEVSSCVTHDAEIWDESASDWTDTFGNGEPIDASTGYQVTNNYDYSRTVADTSGNVYFAWVQSDGTAGGLYFARYDGSDVEIYETDGAPGWTTTLSAGDHIDTGDTAVTGLDMVVDGSDNVYIAINQRDGSNIKRLYLARYTGTDVELWDEDSGANGDWSTTFANADPIDTQTASKDATSPYMAVDGNDYVYISYNQAVTGLLDVHTTRYNTTEVEVWDGSGWDGDTFTNSSRIDTQTLLHMNKGIAIDSSNRVYYLYFGFISSKYRLNMTCYNGTTMQVWETDGTPGWSTTFTDGDPIDNGDSESIGVAHMVAKGANVYWTWDQRITANLKNYIFLGRCDGTDVEIWDNGASDWTTTFADGDPIDTGALNNGSAPRMAIDSAGKVYVAHLKQIGTPKRLHLSRYDGTDVKIWDNGASTWTDTFANGDPIDTGATDCEDPQITVDGSDNVYIAYRQSDGSYDRLYLSAFVSSDVGIWDNGNSEFTDTFANGDGIDTGASYKVDKVWMTTSSTGYVFIPFLQSDGSDVRLYLTRY